MQPGPESDRGASCKYNYIIIIHVHIRVEIASDIIRVHNQKLAHLGTINFICTHAKAEPSFSCGDGWYHKGVYRRAKAPPPPPYYRTLAKEGPWLKHPPPPPPHITVPSRKRAHGRCTLHWTKIGGWTNIRGISIAFIRERAPR